MANEEASHGPQLTQVRSNGEEHQSSAEHHEGSWGSGTTRWWEVLIAFILLSGFAYFVLRWGLEGALHSRKVQVVPDLKGKSVTSALDVLSPINLAVRKEGNEFNAAVPIGTVLRQTPPAGTKVREGKIIRVILSQGGETVFVPNLTGLPLRNAEMLLRQNQLALGEVSESYSLRFEKGMVLTENPKEESSVGRNSLVNVAISGGPPPSGITLMPDFQRKNITDARAWANGANFEINVEQDNAALFPYGVILNQNPAPDTVLAPGSKIIMTISGKTKTEGGQAATRTLHYGVPQGSAENHLRIVLADQYGERELFNGLRPPGSKIDLDVPSAEQPGQARIKIFLNGILVEERDW